MKVFKVLISILTAMTLLSCNPQGAGGEFKLYTKEFNVAGNARTVTIQFISTEDWTLESDSMWASPEVASGEGSQEIQNIVVSIAQNNGGVDRVAEITLSNNSVETAGVIIRQNTKLTSDLLFMTFNIRYPAAEDTGYLSWDNRKKAVAAMLKEVVPDVVGFNEPRDAQREDILAALGSRYDWHMATAKTTSQAGTNFIAWRKDKYNLLSKGYFWLSPTPDVLSRPWPVEGAGDQDVSYRTAVYVHLEEISTGKDFWALITHYPYKSTTADDDARTNSSSLIVERMRAEAGESTPVIMGGDLNCSMYNKKSVGLMPLYKWFEAGRDVALESDAMVHTYNGFLEPDALSDTSIIDHIFCRNFAKVLKFSVITQQYEGVPYISDHYPCTLYCLF